MLKCEITGYGIDKHQPLIKKIKQKLNIMKKLFSFIAIAIISVSMSTASAQLIEGKQAQRISRLV